MHSKYNNLLYIIVLLFASCKEGEKVEYDSVPLIEFKGITPSSISEGDAVTINFSYIDGDGDLGENNPDVKNLFITDNRVGFTYSYRVQQLAPSGSSIAIKGTLNARLDNVFITDTALSQQSVSYSLYIRDRAGHASNTISTPAIVVND